MLRDEYEVNLEAIKEFFPADRYLTQKQMKDYLGVTDSRTLKAIGINGRATRESFAMRLTEGGKEG